MMWSATCRMSATSEFRLSRSTRSTAAMSTPMTGCRNSSVTNGWRGWARAEADGGGGAVHVACARRRRRILPKLRRGSPASSAEKRPPLQHSPETRYNPRLPLHCPTGVPLMYAVVKTGGKQYKVAPGENLKVEQIPADVGAEVILDQVLLVGEGETVRLGQPTLAGATVKATVVAQGRGEKIKIFKMRRRKHYQKHQGGRQNYTELKIESIVG